LRSGALTNLVARLNALTHQAFR